jgi:hypothetical protein
MSHPRRRGPRVGLSCQGNDRHHPRPAHQHPSQTRPLREKVDPAPSHRLAVGTSLAEDAHRRGTTPSSLTHPPSNRTRPETKWNSVSHARQPPRAPSPPSRQSHRQRSQAVDPGLATDNSGQPGQMDPPAPPDKGASPGIYTAFDQTTQQRPITRMRVTAGRGCGHQLVPSWSAGSLARRAAPSLPPRATRAVNVRIQCGTGAQSLRRREIPSVGTRPRC